MVLSYQGKIDREKVLRIFDEMSPHLKTFLNGMVDVQKNHMDDLMEHSQALTSILTMMFDNITKEDSTYILLFSIGERIGKLRSVGVSGNKEIRTLLGDD